MVGLQAVATLLASAAVLAWRTDEAVPALLGGMVAFLPNAYFAWAITRVGPSDTAYVVLAGRALGQWVAKVALTVALLVAAFVAGVGGVGFFIGLGVALLAMLGAPLVAGDEPTVNGDIEA